MAVRVQLGTTGSLLQVMAVSAVFLVVAIPATEAEQIDMLLVLEGHNGLPPFSLTPG